MTCWIARLATALSASLAIVAACPRHGGGAEPDLWRAALSAPRRAERWRPLHGVGALTPTSEGLRIAISGDDPYIESPAVDFPRSQKLLAKFRLRSDTGGSGQLFYYSANANEEQSVRFPVPAGRWHDVALALPALGRGYRFRFDPPGDRGECLLADFRVTRPLAATFPADLRPTALDVAADDRVLKSGPTTLRHASRRWHDFDLAFNEQSVATAHNDPRIAYEWSGTVHWWRFADDPKFMATAALEGERLRVVGEGVDPHGARWRFEQTWVADGHSGFETETRVVVDRERHLVFLPSLAVIVPTRPSIAPAPSPASSTTGSSGSTGKTVRRTGRQALLAGVEYLEDEPSSSEADLAGPAARRRVPAPHKPTFPLMAMQSNGVCVSLEWRRQPGLAPLFDWPDRQLGSEGSVMALIAPGAEPSVRDDGEPLPHSVWPLAADVPLTHRGHVRVESGDSVVPAVKAFVQRRGLPPLPARPTLEAYIAQAGAGWLDGPLRDGARFRHAVGNGFTAQPAFDAAWMLDALASASPAGPRRAAWFGAANEAAAAVAAGQEFFAQVGHLQPPLAGLARGRFRDIQPHAAGVAKQLLGPMNGAFDADGVARYRPPAQGIDYSRTHGSTEANGFAALPVLRALQAALHSGDRELVRAALERLGNLEPFRGGVPRGAQTWEIPLHTPDILAAAHLVKAHVLAYRVTGNLRYLELAREWAWTGVPFVYLDPVDSPQEVRRNPQRNEPANSQPNSPRTESANSQPNSQRHESPNVQPDSERNGSPNVQPASQRHDMPEPSGAVGPYATIAVLGATQWKAPVWIGLPVQWCGLVYADALRWLQPHDPEGPWERLADGITLSAIQQCYPPGHPHAGLLPDSFDLVLQSRNPADINPGTLQPLALELLAGQRSHDLWSMSTNAANADRSRDVTPNDKSRSGDMSALSPTWISAAGRIRRVDAAFLVEPWRASGSQVVVHGAPWPAKVLLNGRPLDEQRLEYLAATRSLVIALPDATPARLEIVPRGE